MSAPVLDVHLSPDDAGAALRHDVLTGLTGTPRTLPPKWLYDARGSELFEQITALPEYYPTRTERALLTDHAGTVAAMSGADTLVELGSGSSYKTRVLLDALRSSGTLRRYVPQDVSPTALRAAADDIAEEYPGVEVHGVVGDFTKDLDKLPGGDRRLVAFLGGTLGNLLPTQRAEFLASVRDVLVPGEHLLLGFGLVVAESLVVPAYDDAAGVTAEFNRNVLRVLNRELRADFDVDAFAHRAVWDAENEWIEMRLRCDTAQHVTLPEVNLEIDLAAGEEIRTEISAKFRISGMAAELEAAGFVAAAHWTDADSRFALLLGRAV